jgi:hypothetical protein
MNPSDITEVWRLNRFTTLPVLLDLLKRKKLVLLDPSRWEDRNDSCILAEYKERKKVKRVLALCFCYGDETIHQWKTFSDGTSGCCIEFDGVRLRKLFDAHKLRHDFVRYKKLRELKKGSILVDEIPFMKRWPYRCEEEYRVIREDNDPGPTYEIEIDLRLIRKVTISQKMPDTVYDTIKGYLREVSNNPTKKINRSTLYENRVWLEKFKNA